MLSLIQMFFLFNLIKEISLKTPITCSPVPPSDFPSPPNNELTYDVDPKFVYFLWNKTFQTANEYAQDYCSNDCENGEPKLKYFKSNVLCLDCECRKPACEIYDICCGQAVNRKTVFNNSSLTAKSPKLGCDEKSIEGFQFLYIRSCPENYHDNEEVKRLCKEDVEVNDTTVETYVRVLDSDTQVVYYNSYCAMCNQVQKPVQLTINATCTSYMLLYMAENMNHLLRLMLLDSDHCQVYQKFEDYVKPFECYKNQFRKGHVDRCDEKHRRKMLDPDIVEACKQFTSNRYQVYNIFSYIYYKNIFCAICDMMSYPFIIKGVNCFQDWGSLKTAPYQMLISFRDENLERDRTFSMNTCNTSSWTSLNGQCLQLKCSPGKKLTNGTCTSIFNQITGLGYRVKALLVFKGWDKLNNFMTVNDLLDIAEEQLSENLNKTSDGFSFHLGIVKDQDTSETIVPMLWANIFILASKFSSRDNFERNAFNLFFNESHNKTQFSFHRILTEDQFTQCCGNDNTNWSLRYNVSENPDMSDSMSLGSKHSIPLSSALTCSFLTFEQFTINFDKSNKGQCVTVTLDLGGTSVVISDISDINTLELTTGNELNVCREILDRYKEMYTLYNNDNFSIMYKAQIVLTILFMGASELCLLMTLVTYLFFPQLRTAPGINNMFLSLSLLLAQLALIVASNIAGPSYLCTFIGIATHFLWLCHFCWCFLCSFHMFLVFTSKTPNQTKKSTDLCIVLLKKLGFSLSVPAVIVSTVIISSYLTSQTIGYGRHFCYLDSTFLIGLSLIGPLCLVSLCNLTFLVVTVSSIHRVNSLMTFDSIKADQFKNLTLYIKLSTVTGAYWMGAIVAEAIDNDILRLVCTMLNGLQGVAIFVSYTCNKRVYQLYSTELRRV